MIRSSILYFHVPEATHHIQSMNSMCMCELLWLCVGEVPPYAIVQTSVKPKLNTQPNLLRFNASNNKLFAV